MKMGILLINKSKNMTSHDVVSILRKKLNTKKIGHTGTLDPMATGVLPICIGNATRVSDYIMEQGKSYIADLEFGKSTTTYDSTGETVNISDTKNFSYDQINEALSTFLGEIDQYPPIYSAIKVDGKKLYEYAREGKEVDIKSRKVTIKNIKILQIDGEKLKIEVSCSKGTYIRSLIHDLGIKLGTFAHMTGLVRNRVGKFNIENSIDISNISEIDTEDLLEKLISIEDSLYNLDKINFLEDISFRIINGQKINVSKFNYEGNFIENKAILIKVLDNFIGIGKVENNILKMEKVLCQ